MIWCILWPGTTSNLALYPACWKTHSHTFVLLICTALRTSILFHWGGPTRASEMQIPLDLRSLERWQNIGVPLLLCSCNWRGWWEGTSRMDLIKTSAYMENVVASAGQSPFSLTLYGDLKGGAVTFVLWGNLTPVATSIPRDQFDNLHFIRVDLSRRKY